MSTRQLTDYLEASAARWPNRPAVIDSDGRPLTYAELNRQADALAAFLVSRGVAGGDRVGVVVPKSHEAVIALFGIMKAGAAYVPVDPTGPVERARRILTDCDIRALVVHARLTDVVPDRTELSRALAALVIVGGPETVRGVRLQADLEVRGVRLQADLQATAFECAVSDFEQLPSVDRQPDDLAYILYTSGSTGMPKGVMLTHTNATSFVDWCSAVFEPTEQDRFSSHAPFHFDLSVLDLYVAIKHGAAVCLIAEDLAKSPRELAQFIDKRHITVWYSTPSTLTLLVQFGQLSQLDVSRLRLVLFAGEVFPVKHLRELKRQWPMPVYYNLYGPTETNVCTFAHIPAVVPEDRTNAYPIGIACAHCRPLVLDEHQQEVPFGGEGLLHISGASVFTGYWNRPVENAAAFLERDAVRWYNTGDVVQWTEAEGFVYRGRKDRMVKRRGFRIELGEIERALYLHPQVREAAVVAVPDADGIRIVATVACSEDRRPSIIDLKTFCARHLPGYMSPDLFVLQTELPKTPTDKVDYQALKRQVAAGAA